VGLLVGAITTQSPELFAAPVRSAPLLHTVRHEHSGLRQLGDAAYGTAPDPEQRDRLLENSPDHNVRDDPHAPAMTPPVSDNDTRVDPLHARKLCAQMQWATSAAPSKHPILLRREAEVGHSARSVSRSVALSAEQLAFLAHHLDLSVE